MKKITLIIAIVFSGMLMQAQSIQKGKFVVSKEKPEFISVLEENIYGLHYSMKFEGINRHKYFKNEDGTKPKIKGSAELFEYMEERGYTYQENLTNMDAQIDTKIFIFKLENKKEKQLKIMRDAKESLEFGLITQEEFDEIKKNILK